ncbi:HET domain-containing protein [Microdochium nivale]|nr:HET domain-containing protein [Microdochium nivale]
MDIQIDKLDVRSKRFVEPLLQPTFRNKPLYEKLPSSGRRLVTIAPGKWAEQVRCLLDTYTPRGKRMKYQALSYVWGHSMSKTPILLNCQDVHVTVNLELALRLLRHVEKEVVFWIDALCINQSDMAERNDQVGQMREIFEQAENVVAFLGHPWMHFPEHRQKVLGMLSQGVSDLDVPHQRSPVLGELEKTRASGAPLPRHLPMPAHLILQFLRLLAHSHPKSADVEAVLHDTKGTFQHYFEGVRVLTTSAWWTRAWILQEIIVPEEATILYGTSRITWSSFCSILKTIASGTVVEQLPPEYNKPLRSLAKLTKSIEGRREEWRSKSLSEKTGLYSLLRDLGGRRATDERDHIYALLGLIDAGQTSLEANYFWDVTQVYAAATLDILTKDKGSLRVLRGDLSRKGIQNLPSWVPDWSMPLDEVDRQRELLIACHKSPPAVSRPALNRRAELHRGAVAGGLEGASGIPPDYDFRLHLKHLGSASPSSVRSLFNLLEDLSALRHQHSQLKWKELLLACSTWSRDEGPELETALGSKMLRKSNNYRLEIPQTSENTSLELEPTILGEIGLSFLPPIHNLGMGQMSQEVSHHLRKILVGFQTTLYTGEKAHYCGLSSWSNFENDHDQGSESNAVLIRALTWDIVPDENGQLRKFDPQSKRDSDALHSWWAARCDLEIERRCTDEERELHGRFDGIFMAGSVRRRFFAMEINLERVYGWGPKLMQRGDLVVHFSMGETPFVVRKTAQHISLIGDCFLLDHMSGSFSMPDYTLACMQWLEGGVTDLLWFREACSPPNMETIDNVLGHVRTVLDNLWISYLTADRLASKDGVVQAVHYID